MEYSISPRDLNKASALSIFEEDASSISTSSPLIKSTNVSIAFSVLLAKSIICFKSLIIILLVLLSGRSSSKSSISISP
jgi:hypothetical protein